MLNVILYTNHHHYCKPTSTNHHPKSTNHRNHNLTTIDSHKHNHCNLSKSSHKNNPKKHHHNERERERERDLYGVPAWWKVAWWDHRLASQERPLGDINNGPKEEAWWDRRLARGSFGRLGWAKVCGYSKAGSESERGRVWGWCYIWLEWFWGEWKKKKKKWKIWDKMDVKDVWLEEGGGEKTSGARLFFLWVHQNSISPN